MYPDSGSSPSCNSFAHLALISGEIKPIPSETSASISTSCGSETVGHIGFSSLPESVTILTTSLNFTSASLTTIILGHGTLILAEHCNAKYADNFAGINLYPSSIPLCVLTDSPSFGPRYLPLLIRRIISSCLFSFINMIVLFFIDPAVPRRRT